MKIWLLMITGLWVTTGIAQTPASVDIPMESQGSRTFYVQSSIQGSGKSMLLVDTGSGHSVINEETLARLMSSGDATFLKDLRGLMADGSTRIVPLYRISAITLGDRCVIKDVEAAVLPNNSRQILGISALQKTAPFGFSFNPPTLSLGNCASADVQPTGNDMATPTELIPGESIPTETVSDETPAENSVNVEQATPTQIQQPTEISG